MDETDETDSVKKIEKATFSFDMVACKLLFGTCIIVALITFVATASSKISENQNEALHEYLERKENNENNSKCEVLAKKEDLINPAEHYKLSKVARSVRNPDFSSEMGKLGNENDENPSKIQMETVVLETENNKSSSKNLNTKNLNQKNAQDLNSKTFDNFSTQNDDRNHDKVSTKNFTETKNKNKLTLGSDTDSPATENEKQTTTSDMKSKHSWSPMLVTLIKSKSDSIHSNSDKDETIVGIKNKATRLGDDLVSEMLGVDDHRTRNQNQEDLSPQTKIKSSNTPTYSDDQIELFCKDSCNKTIMQLKSDNEGMRKEMLKFQNKLKKDYEKKYRTAMKIYHENAKDYWGKKLENVKRELQEAKEEILRLQTELQMGRDE